MKVTLEGVEALVAIVDTGSFAAAAARLHKVPSAVSYQVRQLEQALDTELFDRSGHRAVLTSAGQAMVDEGRFLLARARRMERLAEQFGHGFEGRVQVVLDGALPTGPVLRALTVLGEESVPTHVALRTEYRAGVPRRFAELRADLMVTLEPPLDPLCEVQQLPPVVFVLVCAPGHAAVDQQPLELADLQRHLELSVHDSDLATTEQDTNLIAGARVFYVGDFTAKKEGLQQGLGVGWMPLHLVQDELAAGTLVELRYAPGSRRLFPLAIAWRTDRPLGPAGRRLRALLTAELGG